MSYPITKPPEPIDERGLLKEASEFPPPSSPTEKTPPPRLPSLTFPTDRLPQLDVEIVKRLPGVGDNAVSHARTTNHNIDPSVPSVIAIEKTMYNLWEKTPTQTDVHWSKPANIGSFSGMIYDIQIRVGDEDWRELTENRQPLYRVYYIDGVALFGRNKVTQDANTVKMVRLRIRGIGETTTKGIVSKWFGPWSEDIIFSIEATPQECKSENLADQNGGCENLQGQDNGKVEHFF